MHSAKYVQYKDYQIGKPGFVQKFKTFIRNNKWHRSSPPNFELIRINVSNEIHKKNKNWSQLEKKLNLRSPNITETEVLKVFFVKLKTKLRSYFMGIAQWHCALTSISTARYLWELECTKISCCGKTPASRSGPLNFIIDYKINPTRGMIPLGDMESGHG
jgi:hypothetical protein